MDNDPKILEVTVMEIATMTEVKHPNVLTFYDAYCTDLFIWVFFFDIWKPNKVIDSNGVDGRWNVNALC
jgi:hypothetical protein